MHDALHELSFKKGIGKPKEYIIAQEEHEVGSYDPWCEQFDRQAWAKLFIKYKIPQID